MIVKGQTFPIFSRKIVFFAKDLHMSDYMTERTERHFGFGEIHSSEFGLGWLKHRLGIERYRGTDDKYNTKALELNKDSKEFIDTYGNQTASGYVGFIDLIGFSDAVKEMPPATIGEYITPFICGLLSAASNNDVLIDKTIGDEVMFFIPDRTKEGMAPFPTMNMHYFMADIQKQYSQLGGKYPFRFGIAFGEVAVVIFEGQSYSECSLYGPSVNLAKRLHSLPQLKENDKRWKVSGAFGTLKKQNLKPSSFDALLYYATGNITQFRTTILNPPPPLRGVSDYECAIISPVSPIKMI